MMSPAYIQLVEDIDGTDLGLTEARVDLADVQPMAKFNTVDYEGKVAFGISVRRPVNDLMLTEIHRFPSGSLKLLGGTLAVDLSGLILGSVADHLTCPECFGTGLKGGFQAACSQGCSS